jgi:Flp pilus assembly protein TadD
MSDRIKAIRAMLEKSPRDVFLHYSLGKEYASASQFDLAIEQFRACLELDGNYLPTYVEAGKCYRSVGRFGDARRVFLAGMDVAVAQGEKHTRDFIQQQLDGLAD